MAKANRATPASLSKMLDLVSDEDITQTDDLMLSPESAIEDHALPEKKPSQNSSRVASNPSKVTKAKAPSRRTSGGGPKKAAPKKTNANRKPLADKTNTRYESEVEEVEQFDESMDVDEDESLPPVRTNKKKSKVVERDHVREPVKKPRKRPEQYDEEEEEDSRHAQKPETKKQSRSAPKVRASKGRSTTSKRAPAKSRDHVIPETQPDPMEIEHTSATAEGDQSTVAPLPSTVALKPASSTYRARSESRQRRPERHRSASASDREGRTTDPALRRKLGEATKKLESLEIKYRNLQEIGSRSAESNFEKLKKASDERAKHSNELIASLKKDLVDLQRRFDTQSVEAAASQAKAANLFEQTKKLETENQSLKHTLQQTESENRSLIAKAAANRTASLESAVEKEKDKEKEREKKTQATVAKATNAASRATAAASAEAAKDAQIRQLKEDLYSDLTGLIIRGVKRDEGEDVYDCIQTGRNGTLHFHLTVANPATANEPKTPSNSYQDTEFEYTPLLDDSRDKDLKDVLEDYLQEEIYFPRRQAAKFYAKVLECLTKKIVVEDET